MVSLFNKLFRLAGAQVSGKIKKNKEVVKVVSNLTNFDNLLQNSLS
jgi:hypothetical protein